MFLKIFGNMSICHPGTLITVDKQAQMMTRQSLNWMEAHISELL